MEKVKVHEIVVRDQYGENCLNDSCQSQQDNIRLPRGEVEVYEESDDGKKELVHRSNLVVYLGREMLAQRLVDTENASATPTKDEFVTWFGLGEGGVRPADPLDPVPPTNEDDDLSSPVMLNDATGTVYADPHTAGDPIPVGGTYPKTGYYKKRFDSVEFEPDILNDSRWLVIKITTTISIDDANGEQLSEAGLFSAASRVGAYSGQFSLFSRVTFPSIIKSSDRRLIFVWYLYV